MAQNSAANLAHDLAKIVFHRANKKPTRVAEMIRNVKEWVKIDERAKLEVQMREICSVAGLPNSIACNFTTAIFGIPMKMTSTMWNVEFSPHPMAKLRVSIIEVNRRRTKVYDGEEVVYFKYGAIMGSFNHDGMRLKCITMLVCDQKKRPCLRS